MKKNARIYLAGHTGLVGSALLEQLISQGYTNIITQTIEQADLRNQTIVDYFFKETKPEYVFLAAAKVGGIKANYSYPASFMYDNIMIAANIIHAAYTSQTKKLLFLGSSCIYPRMCPQPIKEEYLLTGPLEPTNEPYALAKIAGIKLCQSYNTQYGTQFISCMPTNLYGPRDNFDIETSHVVPALIAKIYQAKFNGSPTVTLWGTGTARREFLYVHDLAHALIFLMQKYTDTVPINIGIGADITIKELAGVIAQIIGYTGTLVFDATKPDGTPQKLLDVTRINALGWKASTILREGLRATIDWYILQQNRTVSITKHGNSHALQ